MTCIRSVTTPRPRGRGPIEASIMTVLVLCRWLTPRPRGRGPIEASGCGNPGVIDVMTPRPRGRGPIEAGRRKGLQSRSGGLRDRAVAAPLKQEHIEGVEGAPETTPRPRGRGPIEARVSTPQTPPCDRLRDRAVAAPLKQHQPGALLREEHDSATARSRPHLFQDRRGHPTCGRVVPGAGLSPP